MAQHGVAAGVVAEGHIGKFDAAAGLSQCDCPWLVLDVVGGVEDLKDALGRCSGLGHQVDDEAKLTQREEDVGKIQAELLPLAQRQGALNDLATAKVEDDGLAQVGEQEDDREEEGEGARQFELLSEHRIRRASEARLLLRLAGEGFDHFQSGHVFLQDGVESADADLRLHEEGLADRAEDKEDDEGEGQDRQDYQCERMVAEPEHDQRRDEQQQRLQAHHQALPDEQAHLLNVVGGTDHELAGLVAVVIAEGETLHLGK